MSTAPITPNDIDKTPVNDDDLLGPKGDPAEGARNIPGGPEGSDADEEAERIANDRS